VAIGRNKAWTKSFVPFSYWATIAESDLHVLRSERLCGLRAILCDLFVSGILEQAKLAAAFCGKSAQIVKSPEAARLSGYKVGRFSLVQPVRTS
jgi:hypothetical protein